MRPCTNRDTQLTPFHTLKLKVSTGTVITAKTLQNKTNKPELNRSISGVQLNNNELNLQTVITTNYVHCRNVAQCGRHYTTRLTTKPHIPITPSESSTTDKNITCRIFNTCTISELTSHANVRIFTFCLQVFLLCVNAYAEGNPNTCMVLDFLNAYRTPILLW